MNYSKLEIFTGVFTIFLLAFVVFFFINPPLQNNYQGYMINAKCENSQGIIEGSEVRIAGVKVGYVKSVKLDFTNLDSNLVLVFNNGVMIPKDSSAQVSGASLLSNKYIEIYPGGDDHSLKSDDTIIILPGINLERIISQYLYHSTKK